MKKYSTKITHALCALTLFSALLISSCKKDVATRGEGNHPVTNDAAVSKDLAESVALKFITAKAFKGDKLLAKSKTSTIVGVSRTIDQTIQIKGSDETSDLYVVNFKPTGFAIISGTKYDSPILAFSDYSTFSTTDMHPGLKAWIENHKQRIDDIKRRKPKTVPDSVQGPWLASAPPIDNEPPVVSGGSQNQIVGPLLQTTWDQGFPYNEFIPSAGNYNGHSPTGCVATAMAQVMKYWSFPTRYNWSIMPTYAYSSSTGSQEIARLMTGIGVAVGMSYGPNESGAYSSNIAPAFKNSFGYSQYAGQIDYNSDNTVVDLNAHYPVIISGVDPASNSGHAWVCDGYKRTVATIIHNSGTHYQYNTYVISDFYLSMNWGWGGSCNGWYSYNYFNPSGYAFTSQLQEVITIHP